MPKTKAEYEKKRTEYKQATSFLVDYAKRKLTSLNKFNRKNYFSNARTQSDQIRKILDDINKRLGQAARMDTKAKQLRRK